MRIAVIGAGAAGLVTAWRLERVHEVVVYERAPIVGGHVRTLGRNVAWELPIHLDAGVIEFDLRLFPTVHRILRELKVGLTPVPGPTTLFPRKGARYYSPGGSLDARLPMRAWAANELRLRTLLWGYLKMELRRRRSLRQVRLDQVLGDDIFGRWLGLLTMYAYSTPYEQVGGLSAELAVPMLRRFLTADTWVGIVGGTFSYQAKLLEQIRGPIHCNARVSVRRLGGFVELTHEDGSTARFDAVVLACPPHRVLEVLADADESERRRFAGFSGLTAKVQIHGDDGMYRRRHATYASEFDVFELPGGRGGYNARLDRLCSVPASWPARPGLAFGMEQEIDPAKVYARVEHDVARYDVPGMCHRDEVQATQGRRHTWFAGAWLGDGLHEGAFTSAEAVAHALRG